VICLTHKSETYPCQCEWRDNTLKSDSVLGTDSCLRFLYFFCICMCVRFVYLYVWVKRQHPHVWLIPVHRFVCKICVRGWERRGTPSQKKNLQVREFIFEYTYTFTHKDNSSHKTLPTDTASKPRVRECVFVSAFMWSKKACVVARDHAYVTTFWMIYAGITHTHTHTHTHAKRETHTHTHIHYMEWHRSVGFPKF